MDNVVVELDRQTSERVRRLAKAHRTTVINLVQTLIAQLDAAEPTTDFVLGLFADEPVLLDSIVEDVMLTRETQLLRHTNATITT